MALQLYALKSQVIYRGCFAFALSPCKCMREGHREQSGVVEENAQSAHRLRRGVGSGPVPNRERPRSHAVAVIME